MQKSAGPALHEQVLRFESCRWSGCSPNQLYLCLNYLLGLRGGWGWGSAAISTISAITAITAAKAATWCPAKLNTQLAKAGLQRSHHLWISAIWALSGSQSYPVIF
jgi:hypothetical protein